MKNAKLIHFLRLLSPAARKEFRKYVASPLFNERDILVELLQVLERHCLRPDSNFTAEQVYQKLYGGRPFNKASLKTSMSQLFGLMRDYLAYSKFSENDIARNRFFLQKLNDLGESKYFRPYHEKASKALEKANIGFSDACFEWMHLDEIMDLYELRQPERTSRTLLKMSTEVLGNGFLMRMLRNKFDAVNSSKTTQQDLDSPLMELAIAFIEDEYDKQPIPIQVYFNMLKVLENPEDTDRYLQALEVLHASSNLLSRNESGELYIIALNIALRRINAGELDFLVHAFSLYEKMLEEKLILERGRISPFHFKNIVVAALRLGKFEWTGKFIDEWREKVFGDHAENAFQFNQGVFRYYQQDYETAERHFYKVLDDFQDIFYGLNSRGYLLQIYFETGNMRGLESLAHSSRMYLSRNKVISDRKRRMYMHFINHLLKLINIPPKNKDKLRKLYFEIKEKQEKGMGSGWLLKKIGEMLGEEELDKVG